MSEKYLRIMERKNLELSGIEMRKSQLQFNRELQMFTIDRPVLSCTHCTSFCRKYCYTHKAYDMYPNMETGDFRSEYVWQHLDPAKLRDELARKKSRDVSVVRLMSRGEAFSELEDIQRVKQLLATNPETAFWIPTRAWRDERFRPLIESEIMPLANAFVSASIDPTSTPEEVRLLKDNGWSLMFFGIDDIGEAEKKFGVEFCPCPKTHDKDHQKGICLRCRQCFSEKGTAIHLKRH